MLCVRVYNSLVFNLHHFLSHKKQWISGHKQMELLTSRHRPKIKMLLYLSSKYMFLRTGYINKTNVFNVVWSILVFILVSNFHFEVTFKLENWKLTFDRHTSFDIMSNSQSFQHLDLSCAFNVTLHAFRSRR